MDNDADNSSSEDDSDDEPVPSFAELVGRTPAAAGNAFVARCKRRSERFGASALASAPAPSRPVQVSEVL